MLTESMVLRPVRQWKTEILMQVVGKSKFYYFDNENYCVGFGDTPKEAYKNTCHKWRDYLYFVESRKNNEYRTY